MKQFDVKAERVLNGNRYFIRPFPAFTAANLSGELAGVPTPVLAALVPLASSGGIGEDINLLDIDAEKAAPALAKGFSSLNGDKVENLLQKLLVRYRNVSVEMVSEQDVQPLTEDLANEVFCGDAQDMFILAFEVIKANFSGFFGNLGSLFGNPAEIIRKG